MNRREFLQKSAIVATAAVVAPLVIVKKSYLDLIDEQIAMGKDVHIYGHTFADGYFDNCGELIKSGDIIELYEFNSGFCILNPNATVKVMVID